MAGNIEHANISVGDLNAAIKFFQTAFPHWRIRGEGGDDQSRWVHLGTDDTYVCLNAALASDYARSRGHRGYGFNHIGFVVDDAKGLRQKMLDAGYRKGIDGEYDEFRTRVYILDPDEVEYEFIEYHSDDPDERNRYH